MNYKACRRIFGALAFLLFFPSLLAAQNSVKCESNDGRRQYCGSYNYDQVRFDRQISNSPCVQGRTWGVDGRGLWVDQGCRAYFVIVSGGRPVPPPPPPPGPGPEGPWWQPGPDDTWPPRGNWRGGNWGSGGACFYQNPGFSGPYFCMRRGDSREYLAEYGNSISSIRTFGGAHVTVYEGRGYTGSKDRINGTVPNLKQFPVSQRPGKTWNNRISSLRVR